MCGQFADLRGGRGVCKKEGVFLRGVNTPMHTMCLGNYRETRKMLILKYILCKVAVWKIGAKFNIKYKT